MASHLSLLLLVAFCLAAAQAQLRLYDLRASDLPASIFGVTDGYVEVTVGSTPLGKTSVRRNDKNPWWDEEFSWFHAQEGDILKLEVYDDDILFDDLIGTCSRELRSGTYEIDCFLKKSGTLHYFYTVG